MPTQLITVIARKPAWFMISLLIGAATMSGCGGQPLSPSQTTLLTPRVVVPMMINRNGMPEVDAIVEGKRIRCIVDTGSFASQVAPSLTRRAALAVQPPPIQTVDAGGNRHTTVLIAIPSCSIGKATFTHFAAIETDLKFVAPLLARPGVQAPEMVLAPVIFRDVLWTIDYATGRMVMENGELPLPDGKEILPMQVDASGRLLIPGNRENQEVWLMMDTGFSGGLAIPNWTMSAFPGAGEALATGEIQFYYGKGVFSVSRLGQDLNFGQHVISRPMFMSMVGKDPVVGAEYLKRFTITIDQRNQRIRLHRDSALPIRSAAPAMLSLYVRREDGSITGIKEGGTAQRAGVHVGDRVLSIDGIPLPNFLAGKRPFWSPHPGYITFEILPKTSANRLIVQIPIAEMTHTSTSQPAGR